MPAVYRLSQIPGWAMVALRSLALGLAVCLVEACGSFGSNEGPAFEAARFALTYQGQGPVPVISGGPFSGSAPLGVYLDATNSYTRASGGWIRAFSWNLGDGATTTASYLVHTYQDPGTYTVMLTATDGTGVTATTTQVIQVAGTSGGSSGSTSRGSSGSMSGGSSGTTSGSTGASSGSGTTSGGSLAFQPGFHQALRANEVASKLTTYRMRIPVGRAGQPIKITFRSGDGPLRVSAANVAMAGGDGALKGSPVSLTFGGKSGFSVGSRTLVTSDPAPFAMPFHQDIYVSFEATGNLAVSAIALFPESYRELGSHSLDPSLAGQRPHPQAIGVATIYVDAAPTRAAIILGDSITEGYVESCVPWTSACGVPPDDYRNTWGYVAEGILGWPVLNAAASGQDAETALANLNQEVLAVTGVTDSVSLLGTNDLGGPETPQDIEGVLAQIYGQLQPPFSSVYGATLLPKDPKVSNLSTVQAQLTEVNQWLRSGQPTFSHLLDFQSVLWASPSDPVDFAPGLSVDGIHPSVEGQLLLGRYTAQQMAASGAP